MNTGVMSMKGNAMTEPTSCNDSRGLARTGWALAAVLAAAAPSLPACAQTAPSVVPPGADKSLKTEALVAGARLLQGNSPLAPMDVYLVGFHPIKNDPQHQMEAHHYCHQVNEDFAQCVLFDGNTKSANLNGIEYIVSAALYARLPENERRYWHPHNYEILSGELVGPGLPEVAEHALMKGKINSYGKTWHVWSTGTPQHPGDALPLGEPMLAWSFNRDGEARPEMVRERDQRMGIDTAQKRRDRADLVPLAKPQHGVDALRGRFPGAASTTIPGVIEAIPR